MAGPKKSLCGLLPRCPRLQLFYLPNLSLEALTGAFVNILKRQGYGRAGFELLRARMLAGRKTGV